MSSVTSIAQESAGEPFNFDEMIKNLLLAMVAAQNEATASFVEGISELAGTEVEIKYKTGTAEKTITGNALAFGILPTLLQIQSGVIEIKVALTMQRKSETKAGVKSKMSFSIFSDSVDAKYSNTYSYKAEASSYIRIQVAPIPPPHPLLQVVEKITQETPPLAPK